MVCAESLCCGTPVVGFKAGAPEMIAIPEYSRFVEFGDMDALDNAVPRWLESSDVEKTSISVTAQQRYSRENMMKEYIEIYRGLSNEASC